MKVCPKCKTSISDTAKFCVNCGFNLKKYEEENSKHFCPECGTEFSGGKFCPECGYNIEKDLNPKKDILSTDFGLEISESKKKVKMQLNSDEYNSFEVKEYDKGKYIIVKYLDIYEPNVVIPKDVIGISESAFEGTAITKVKLNNGIKTIGKRAFANCAYLEKINIPTSLDKIDDEAFCECEKLKLQIPDSVSIVGKNIFWSPKKYEAILNEGIKLFKKEDYKEAFIKFVDASKKGNADAEYYIGLCYNKGLGVKQDYNKAYEFYLKASEKKHALAFNDLAILYENGLGVEQNYKKAYDYANKAAKLKVEEAYYRVGYFLYNGLGVKQDYKKAYEWYLKAAELENPLAMCGLGIMFEAGLGVKQNKKSAAEWLSKASRFDCVEAEYLLGKIEEENSCYYKAYDYYSYAASKNHAMATYKLSIFYEKGLGVDKNLNKAFELVGKAANLGIVDAMYQYAENLSSEKDFNNSYEWYLKAANQNHMAAIAKVGNCLENGIGVNKDCAKAFDWYMLLAKQGYLNYEFKVGSFYELGIGVTPNYPNAYMWYHKAAEKGIVNAINKVIKMLYYGYGVDTDYSEIRDWANKLIKMGKEYAYCILGKLEEINGDDAQAEELYLKVLHLSSGEAQYHLGELEYKNKRFAKAVDWYKIAKNKKNAWAYVKQSIMYYRGEVPGVYNRVYNGFSSNHINAIALAQDAARLGLDKGQRLLGEYYYEGIGTKKNNTLAFKYMELAANQGDHECEAYYGEKLAWNGSLDKNKAMLEKGIVYLERAANKLSRYQKDLKDAKEWLNKLKK